MKNQDFSLLHAGRYGGRDPVERHSHPGLELILHTRGGCRHQLEGTEWIECVTGQLLAVPAGTPHRQESLGDAATSYIVLGNTAPSDLPAAACPCDDLAENCFHLIVDLWLSAHPARESMLPGLLAALLAALRQPADTAIPNRLLAARRRLEREYADPGLSLAQVAAACGMSYSTFCTGFKAAFGAVPVRYLARKRLELAGRLLRDPRLNVAECARASGFADANYFARRFRRHFGCAPGEYRKRFTT